MFKWASLWGIDLWLRKAEAKSIVEAAEARSGSDLKIEIFKVKNDRFCSNFSDFSVQERGQRFEQLQGK